MLLAVVIHCESVYIHLDEADIGLVNQSPREIFFTSHQHTVYSADFSTYSHLNVPANRI